MDKFPRQPINGFTLIELVIVILVVSILALFVNINWSGYTINVGAQAEQLATDLRYVQSLSMTQGNRFCLRISGSTYQVIDSSTNTPQVLAFGNTTVTLGKNLSFGTISPASTALFVFDGTGVPYASTATSCTATNANGATAITSTASIPITSGTDTKTISISAETGRIIVQ